jgi:hypothetical protein
VDLSSVVGANAMVNWRASDRLAFGSGLINGEPLLVETQEILRAIGAAKQADARSFETLSSTIAISI